MDVACGARAAGAPPAAAQNPDQAKDQTKDQVADHGKFPIRPIRIVSPFAAGSASDLSLRLLADKLGARLGGQIVIDNQPRAGGVTAATSVLTSPADGYTHCAAFNLDRDQRVAVQAPAL